MADGGIGTNIYEAFGVVKAYRKFATSASADQQLCRLPWFWSQGAISGKLVRVTIGNPSGVVVTVRFWDQDLTNGTPPSKGSGSVQGALLVLSGTASTSSGTQLSTNYNLDSLPSPEFYSGIAFQVSDVNVAVYAEVRLK
jgi:hypothetical protein